jgi:hypothetical protein
MSRSNGPAGRGQSPQWRQDQQQGQPPPRASWPPEAYQAEDYAQDPAAQHAQQHAQHQYAAPAPQQGYHFPEAAEPVTAARTAPPHPSRAVAYGQQYDRYAQPPQAAPPPASYPPADPRMAQHAQPQTGWPPVQDPRNYDLGNFMPSDTDHAQQVPYQGQSYPTQPQQRTARSAYGGEPGEPSLDAAHYGAPHPQAGYQQAAHTQAGPQDQGYAEADEYEQAEDEQENTGRGRRGLVIVAALIGAIALGGGLAYAYKAFGSKLIAGNKQPAPVVKAPVEAAKTKPATPDGKQFANQDSKVLNERIGGSIPPPAESAAASQMSAAIQAGNDPNGARAVRTIPITAPGGAVTVPVPAPQPPAAAAPPLAKIVTAAVPTPPPAPPPPAAVAAKVAPPAAAAPAAAPAEAPKKVGGPKAPVRLCRRSRLAHVACRCDERLRRPAAEVR